ncbi:hypothetical protein HZA99_04275 [Candidatus Woesearchaeota archaeon]|nr:hypothetical protein [Candidatus Woesearchaeota archaeon]
MELTDVVTDVVAGLPPHIIEGQKKDGTRFQLFVEYAGLCEQQTPGVALAHRISAILPEINGRTVRAEVAYLDFAPERLEQFAQMHLGYTFVRESYRGIGVFRSLYDAFLDIGHGVFPEGFRVFMEVDRTSRTMMHFAASHLYSRVGNSEGFIHYQLFVPPKPSE